MSYVQQYTKIIKMPTLKTYFSEILSKLKPTRSQITSALYILNWKSSYDVTLFMCQSRSTIFPRILIFVIFRLRDMQEYIFMFSIALEWIVNSICDHPIDAVKFSNTIQLSPRQAISVKFIVRNIWVSHIVYKQVHSVQEYSIPSGLSTAGQISDALRQ